jgi:hypothetical protein
MIRRTATCRDRSVSTQAELIAGRPGVDSRERQIFFTSPPRPDRLWGPSSLLSNGYREHEADRLPTSSV